MTRAIVFALAVVTAWAILPRILSAVIPADLWFEVGPVYVEENSLAGVPPIVVPTRTIHRDFLGHWSANVYRNQGGVFRLHCHREAPEPFWYRVPAVAPSAAPEEAAPPIDMNWWLEIPPNPPCTWPAGEYRMVTRWEVILLGGFVRIPVERNSNVFHLRDGAP